MAGIVSKSLRLITHYHPGNKIPPENGTKKFINTCIYNYLFYFCCVKAKKTPTPNFDSIQPSGCVNAKLRRLHRLLNLHYQKAYKPFGLQGTMVPIMFMVGKTPGINQKTIADRLVLGQSTMSRDIQKLCYKNWLVVTKGSDPRHSELYITAEGYKLLEKIAPVWQQMHSKTNTLLGSFNIQLIDQLIAAIQQMPENN